MNPFEHAWGILKELTPAQLRAASFGIDPTLGRRGHATERAAPGEMTRHRMMSESEKNEMGEQMRGPRDEPLSEWARKVGGSARYDPTLERRGPDEQAAREQAEMEEPLGDEPFHDAPLHPEQIWADSEAYEDLESQAGHLWDEKKRELENLPPSGVISDEPPQPFVPSSVLDWRRERARQDREEATQARHIAVTGGGPPPVPGTPGYPEALARWNAQQPQRAPKRRQRGGGSGGRRQRGR